MKRNENGTERQNECCLCLLRSPSAISYKMIINGTEGNGKMNSYDNKKQFSPMFIRQNECCLCLLRSPSAISYKLIINGTEWNGTERNGKMNTYDNKNKKQFSPMFIRQNEKNVCWDCYTKQSNLACQGTPKARLAPEGFWTNDVIRDVISSTVIVELMMFRSSSKIQKLWC